MAAQGLDWYTSSMRQDADGDLADQFLSEPSAGHAPKRQRSGRERELPALQVRAVALTPVAGSGSFDYHASGLTPCRISVQTL